jgi:hypothetical protein
MITFEINVEDSAEVRFWIKELHVDERTLRNAVKAVGPTVENVRVYLRTSQSIVRRSDLPEGSSGDRG